MDDKTREAMRRALREISDETEESSGLGPASADEIEQGVDDLYAMLQKHGLLIIYAQS